MMKTFKQTYPLKRWLQSNIADPNYTLYCYPDNAKKAGYQSATYWKNRKRVVINPEMPSAVVPTGTMRQVNHNLPNAPYLRKDGQHYIVATRYHYYYSVDRTVTKAEYKASTLGIPPLTLRDAGQPGVPGSPEKSSFLPKVEDTSVPTLSSCSFPPPSFFPPLRCPTGN